MSRAGKTQAEARAQGRLDERADLLALIGEMEKGVPELSAKYRAAGQGDDAAFALHLERLKALRSTIEAGCHIGLAQ